MATWNSRGLRGSTLEDLVNRTNEQYREKGLALIQKIPTPITPVRMDKENRHITLAYFEQRSTVDYIGAVQGIPVCFDAKECCVKTFPLANIHPHQVAFMEEFEKQKGISFFLIYFSADNVFYYFTQTERILETDGRGRTKKFPPGRIGRGILSSGKKRISGSLSGGDPERSAITGLTFGKVSYIIKFKFFCGSMVAN